jgi:hypothetical protein
MLFKAAKKKPKYLRHVAPLLLATLGGWGEVECFHGESEDLKK